MRGAALAVAVLAIFLAACGGGKSPTLNPTPAISSIFPDTTTALDLADCSSGPTFILAVLGTGFFSTSSMDQSQVLFNGSPRATTFDAITEQLSATITACDIQSAGTAQISVSNPSPGGGASGSITFIINPQSNSQPSITMLSPADTPAGGAGFTLTVSGTNFLATSSVAFNGSPRATAFNPGTGALTANILSADILCPGVASVTVTNPAPGGGSSLGSPFMIDPAMSTQPCILGLSPAFVPAGSMSFPLVVTGTNFNAGSTVLFNGSMRATTFNPSTGRLTATITAGDVAVAGMVNITVTNAAGTSAPFLFTIN